METSFDLENYLHDVYEGEILGEALYASLAEQTKDVVQAHRWRLLERLERVVKTRLRLELEKRGRPAADNPKKVEEGRAYATAFAAISWEEQLHVFLESIRVFTDEFRQAHASARGDGREATQYVLVHEEALLHFFEAEVRGEPAHSRDKLLAFLDQQLYRGSCHCGLVRFEAIGKLDRATQCNCSICARKGYLHHMVEAEAFELVSGAEDLTTYQFGTGTALHQFCKRCGVASFYRPRLEPSKFMLNLRCIEGLDLDSVRIEPFDGRNWEAHPDAPYTGSWKQRA